MIHQEKGSRICTHGVRLISLTGVLAGSLMAQYGGGGMSGPQMVFTRNYHVGFDKPEAWGLKYFASTSLLAGLPPPTSSESYHTGSISVGMESDWLPSLDAGQRTIGFGGTKPEDLNKAPIYARAVVRVGLPDKFTALIAVPPPFHVFGVTPHLVAFGLERPIVETDSFTFGWRGYGQLGSVKGSFTCPDDFHEYDGPPGTATNCLGPSADRASLRYAGSERSSPTRFAGCRR